MRLFGCLTCVSLLGLIAGCDGGVVENPAEVLEGTWQMTFEEPGDLEGFDIQATFDADGQLAEITAESPEGGTAMLDVDPGSTTTEVDGNDVTITVEVVGGVRVLEGTLSEDENTITGDLSSELELPSGDLDVTLPGSGVTLERIE